MGGEYYLFEIFGLSLTLLNNKGEVQIPERSDWPYYGFLRVEGAMDHQIINAIAQYLAQIARHAGLEAEVAQTVA